jgi:hypothetical protein
MKRQPMSKIVMALSVFWEVSATGARAGVVLGLLRVCRFSGNLGTFAAPLSLSAPHVPRIASQSTF